MSATNQTVNYGLPIFVDTDQPTYLGDWNSAMNKIDQTIKDNTGDTSDLENQIANITTRVSNTEKDIEGNATDIANLEKVVEPLPGRITANEQSITQLAAKDRDLQQQINDLPDQGYTLPVASSTRLGGVKVGTNLSIDANGVLSAELGSGGGVIDIPDGAITTPKLATSAVSTTKLADNSVTTQKIVANAVAWGNLSSDVQNRISGGGIGDITKCATFVGTYGTDSSAKAWGKIVNVQIAINNAPAATDGTYKRTVVGTLDAGYRPSNQLICGVHAGYDAVGYIGVDASGAIFTSLASKSSTTVVVNDRITFFIGE